MMRNETLRAWLPVPVGGRNAGAPCAGNRSPGDKGPAALDPGCRASEGVRFNRSASAGRRKQDGAVLITALIMLAILTLIGVTGMTGTTLEERMAANAQEVNRAFQAAETGLAALFNGTDTLVTSGKFGDSNDDIGAYSADVSYDSEFRQQTAPPRGSGWDTSYGFYYFSLHSVGETESGAESELYGGAYQIGPST